MALQLTDVPSTRSFTCVGKQRQQYGQYFVALLRITIFHDEANTTSCVGREKLWYRKLEYPPETHPLLVWDPDPHENDLTAERCAASKREQHVPFVVGMRRDVTPDDFRTEQKVPKDRNNGPRNANKLVLLRTNLAVLS